MSPQVFVVVPYGKRWGVSTDGKVLAVANSKRAAEDLARKAARALESGSDEARERRVLRSEPRSFRED